MTKIILQTSKYKPATPKGDSLNTFAKGWDYVHFDDDEIIQFFKDNPIAGFENIEKRFYEIPRGEFRADLFRYYYIYLNGGFFIDSDFELRENLDNVIQDYEFVTAELKSYEPGAWGSTNRSRAFNGYMYASKPKNKIIFQCLQHLYHIDVTDLGPLDGGWDSRYHSVCEYFYNVIQAYPDKSKIKVYKITDNHGSYILDGNKVLGQHFASAKENKPLKPNSESNAGGPVLFFCQKTIETAYNSGIQRHVREMAKGLLQNNVQLIPIKLNKRKQFEILSEDELKIFSEFDGPPLHSWTYNRNLTLRESMKYIKRANYIIYPELQSNKLKEIKSILIWSQRYNLKLVSVFHDAVPAILKDYYSSSHAEMFLEYMNDLSQSDFIFSVSESSNKDYQQFVNKPRNTKLKSIALPSPHNIVKNNGFSEKVNNSKNIEVLCVSSIMARKNHVNFLKAYSIAQKKLQELGYKINLSLIAAEVNVPKNYLEEFNLLVNETNANLRVNISEEDLQEAYRNADFTIYPSVYEGYGLPIVESLNTKTPVACSNTSSMIEVAQLGGCITFDPHSIDDMANAIILLATDSKKRNSLVKEIESIKEYSWKDYTSSILKTIGY
jgi:glycosyltransferase involved in cell wall biosynthesis